MWFVKYLCRKRYHIILIGSSLLCGIAVARNDYKTAIPWYIAGVVAWMIVSEK